MEWSAHLPIVRGGGVTNSDVIFGVDFYDVE